MSVKITELSWSTGKDSAWALHQLRLASDVRVVGLFSTVSETFHRVSMHGVRNSLLEAQAKLLNLPLFLIKIPYPCGHDLYGQRMGEFVETAKTRGIEQFAFGDLFLTDVRKYREDKLRETGIKPIFPIWGLDCKELGRTMIESGLKAKITCLNPNKVPKSLAGQEFDLNFLSQLPDSVDPCGEYGEFHTFVYDGPMFDKPIDIKPGEIVERDGLVFADFTLAE